MQLQTVDHVRLSTTNVGKTIKCTKMHLYAMVELFQPL